MRVENLAEIWCSQVVTPHVPGGCAGYPIDAPSPGGVELWDRRAWRIDL